MTARLLHPYAVGLMALLELSVGICLAIVCAVILARLLAPDLAPGGGTLWRIFTVVACFGIAVTVASLIAGLGGFLHGLGLCATLAVGAIAGGAYLARRDRYPLAAAEPALAPQNVEVPAHARLASVSMALGVVVGLVPLSLVAAELLLGGCRFEFDDYSYHGLMLGHWLQRDALHLAPAKYQAYYPGGSELFSAFFVELGGGDALAQVASLYWAVLAMLSFPVAATALGTAPALAWMAAGLLLCSPVVRDNLGTLASVDFAAGAASLATIAVGLTLANDPAVARPRRSLLLMGLLAGLAIGIKVTAAVIALPVLAVSGVIVARRARESLGLLALYALLGGVVAGGYWYIRNLVITGNPVFPAEVLFFDGPLDRGFQRSTSLLVRMLEEDKPRRLERIWEDLTSWPVALAWVGAAGLAHALAVAPVMRTRGRRALPPLVALLAIASFWVTFAGPFSGSVNAFGAVTRVSTRMFLPCLMLALLLVGSALPRPRSFVTSALSLVLVLAGAAVVATLVAEDERLMPASIFAAMATALWCARVAIARSLERLPRVARSLAAAIALLGAIVLLGRTAQQQQPSFDARNRGWLKGVLKDLPAGTRIATPNVFSYYALFGPDFELDPIRVDDDGQPYPLLHVEWRQNPHYSWKYEFGAKWKKDLRAKYEAKIPKTGWRAIEDRKARREARIRFTLESLEATGADYVFVASYHKASVLHGAKPKPRKQPFPGIADLLDQSERFRRARVSDDVRLYERAR